MEKVEWGTWQVICFHVYKQTKIYLYVCVHMYLFLHKLAPEGYIENGNHDCL